MVKRGEEKVRVHMNVVGLSSTSIYTSELILSSLSSTSIYTSELILCSTICVPSATRHNMHMYPYFLFAALHNPKSSPTFSLTS